jgi:signal transduction histidine kinase
VFVVILVVFIVLIYIRLRVIRFKELNLLLETKVKERTLELEEANTELEEQQEEINSQKEELTVQKESLEETNEFLRTIQLEVIAQNKELDVYRNKLESLVDARTLELLEALKKAEESDRLKSSFLANMSHEIRTPMNAIMGFSSLLQEKDVEEPQKHNYLSNIQRNSKLLLVLINDILDLSRIQANQLNFSFQPENLKVILDETYQTFNIEVLKKDIQLKLNTKKIQNSQVIVTDKFRFKQVISNLLSNAIKFTQKGIVEFGIHDISNQLVIYVKDTGIGIPRKAGESIFERFLKLEEDKDHLYRGTGLGLTICKSLVSMWNGKIWYKSEENVGTTFYFSHPLNQDKPELKSEQKKEKRPLHLKLEGKTILVAEDEESNYQLLLAYLLKTGATVLWAQNGEETCEMVDSNNVDLILMDVKMPVMGGLEASKIIKQKHPDIPIIIQTAFTSSIQKEQILENIIDSFILKPIEFRELFNKIAELI